MPSRRGSEPKLRLHRGDGIRVWHRLEVPIAARCRKRMLRMCVVTGKLGSRQRLRSVDNLMVPTIIQRPVRMRSTLPARGRFGFGDVSKRMRLSRRGRINDGRVIVRVRGVMPEWIVVRERIGIRLRWWCV